MSVLSDVSIEVYSNVSSLIEPFNIENLQPASYDLTLGEFYNYIGVSIDLNPREFIIASTRETVNLPANIVGRIEGKSSWARKGLIIHTAGFVDPGFRGQLTLEITNLSDEIIPLKLGLRIAQIAFQFLDKPANRPYGTPGLDSHYQDQRGPTPSKL